MCVCVCVCILALVVQHAKRMRRIILSSVACLALPYFSTLSHKRCNLRWGVGVGTENFIEHEMCFYCCTILSGTFLILRIQPDTLINVHSFM